MSGLSWHETTHVCEEGHNRNLTCVHALPAAIGAGYEVNTCILEAAVREAAATAGVVRYKLATNGVYAVAEFLHGMSSRSNCNEILTIRLRRTDDDRSCISIRPGCPCECHETVDSCRCSRSEFDCMLRAQASFLELQQRPQL